MTHGSGHFGFESILFIALAVLVATSLTMIAHAVLTSTAVA